MKDYPAYGYDPRLLAEEIAKELKQEYKLFYTGKLSPEFYAQTTYLTAIGDRDTKHKYKHCEIAEENDFFNKDGCDPGCIAPSEYTCGGCRNRFDCDFHDWTSG